MVISPLFVPNPAANGTVTEISFEQFSALFSDSMEKNRLSEFSDAKRIESFFELTRCLLEVNAHTNLTAIRSVDEMISLHYADSLKLSSYLPQGARVLDLGCGAGFPSLPLAIARPDLQITGLDSTAKKIRFVADTAKALSLNNYTAVSARAEELAAKSSYREHFDVCCARAVARLSVLSELCVPFVRVGGQFLSMKGAKAQEELTEAKHGLSLLGCREVSANFYELSVPSGTESRAILTCLKSKSTPAAYPRRYAQILKSPL